jgi:hypothetical protein
MDLHTPLHWATNPKATAKAIKELLDPEVVEDVFFPPLTLEKIVTVGKNAFHGFSNGKLPNLSSYGCSNYGRC